MAILKISSRVYHLGEKFKKRGGGFSRRDKFNFETLSIQSDIKSETGGIKSNNSMNIVLCEIPQCKNKRICLPF